MGFFVTEEIKFENGLSIPNSYWTIKGILSRHKRNLNGIFLSYGENVPEEYTYRITFNYFVYYNKPTNENLLPLSSGCLSVGYNLGDNMDLLAYNKLKALHMLEGLTLVDDL